MVITRSDVSDCEMLEVDFEIGSLNFPDNKHDVLRRRISSTEFSLTMLAIEATAGKRSARQVQVSLRATLIMWAIPGDMVLTFGAELGFPFMQLQRPQGSSWFTFGNDAAI